MYLASGTEVERRGLYLRLEPSTMLRILVHIHICAAVDRPAFLDADMTCHNGGEAKASANTVQSPTPKDGPTAEAANRPSLSAQPSSPPSDKPLGQDLTPREILERLHDLDGPNRELDAHIAVAMRDANYLNDPFLTREGMVWSAACQKSCSAAPYTASIDAALNLIKQKLPDWHWELFGPDRTGGMPAGLLYHHDPCQDGRRVAKAATPAMALLAALIMVLEAI